MAPARGTHDPSRRTRWGLFGGFVALLAISVPIGILSWVEIVGGQANVREAERSRHIGDALRDAAGRLHEMHALLHEYALDGRAATLQRLREAETQVERGLHRIETLLGTERAADIGPLRARLHEAYAISNRVIDVVQRESREAALEAFSRLARHDNFARARDAVQTLLARERAIGQALDAESARLAAVTRLAILASALASISVYVFAMTLAIRHFRRSDEAERIARERLERTRRQFDVVGEVGRSEQLIAGEVEAVAERITELAAKTVGCERVNAWLFNEDETELYCIDLYEAAPDRHSSGMVLREHEYRAEFHAIKSSRYVNADDPLTDSRTAGYVETYLKPLGITSMLDAVIHASGANLGLLCFEHVGKPHHWEPDEIAFACQLADKIGITLMSRRRRTAEEKVRASEAALAQAQAVGRVGSWELDFKSRSIDWSPQTYLIFGLDRNTFKPAYESVMSRFHPDDRAKVETCVKEALADQRPFVVDHRILMRDGSIKWVHERGETQYDDAGSPVRTVGTVQDITDRIEAETVLRRERDFSAALIEGLPGIFFVIDADGRNIRVNANLSAVTGRSSAELDRMNALDVIAPADRARVGAKIRAVIETGQAEDEFSIVHRDGGERRILAGARRIDLEHGPGILGIGIDVTEARRDEQLLRQSEEKLRVIFASVSDGISLADPDTGKIVEVNDAGARMAGYARDELVGRDIGILASGLPPHTAEGAHEWVAKARLLGPQTFEWQCKRKDGSPFWADMTIRFATFGGKELILATIRDITERKRDEQRILQMARFDGLTGLANRRVFADAVQQAIARTRRGEKGFAVLYLDLDHFKDINDTLGHPVGDALLKAIGERLRFCVRATDTVARFGGDEFAVLAAEIDEPTDAGVLADKIIEVVSRPATIDGNEIRIGTSVGIAVHGSDSPDAEVLLAHADVALYRAKWEGRGIYRFFTEAMDAEVRSRVSLDADLREAMAEDQFFVLYQPQVDSLTGRITGVEALVRWRHPQRGVMSPAQFVPAAERSGFIVPLGRWVLREACRTARAWKDDGIAPLVVGVNVSALQFKTPGELERDIAGALAESGMPAQCLELELTETVLMDASREHNDELLRLRQSGVRIAIDDFGTGYSSLDYLRQYPVDRIKIAQVFIADLLRSQGDVAIVKAAIGLARELGIDIIAEGVETLEQLSLLQDWGCRQVQGYYFAKPLPAAELMSFLRRGRMQPVQAPPLPVPA